MEWNGGNLEEDSDQNQHQRGNNQGMALCSRYQASYFEDRCRSSGAKDECNPVEQECGGERAKQKILDGSFRTAASLLAITSQNVSGDGRDLQRDEDHQQFDRAAEQAH